MSPLARMYNRAQAMDNAAKVVVITGSTRGIGFGLAESFLKKGCRIVVSGRSSTAVDEAVARLGERVEAGENRVFGKACDVGDSVELEALWAACVAKFGRVDFWINNAGYCNAIRSFIELPADQIASVVDTNMRGTMLGSQVALRGFVEQGYGQLFNMEGWGSHGERKAGMTPYCASKLAIRYFSDELAREFSSTAPRVCIGTLSPGMVVTDSLVESYRNGGAASWARSRWLFHFVIDPRETVCDWLAEKALANRRTGAHFRWMTTLRLFVRFLQPHYWRRNPVLGTPLDALGRGKGDPG